MSNQFIISDSNSTTVDTFNSSPQPINPPQSGTFLGGHTVQQVSSCSLEKTPIPSWLEILGQHPAITLSQIGSSVSNFFFKKAPSLTDLHDVIPRDQEAFNVAITNLRGALREQKSRFKNHIATAQKSSLHETYAKNFQSALTFLEEASKYLEKADRYSRLATQMTECITFLEESLEYRKLARELDEEVKQQEQEGEEFLDEKSDGEDSLEGDEDLEYSKIKAAQERETSAKKNKIMNYCVQAAAAERKAEEISQNSSFKNLLFTSETVYFLRKAQYQLEEGALYYQRAGLLQSGSGEEGPNPKDIESLTQTATIAQLEAEIFNERALILKKINSPNRSSETASKETSRMLLKELSSHYEKACASLEKLKQLSLLHDSETERLDISTIRNEYAEVIANLASNTKEALKLMRETPSDNKRITALIDTLNHGKAAFAALEKKVEYVNSPQSTAFRAAYVPSINQGNQAIPDEIKEN